MNETYLSISEKTDGNKRRAHYILHNGWEYYHADTNIKEDMKSLLDFFEIKVMDIKQKSKTEYAGETVFYNVSKNIISKCGGGFWSVEQMREMAGSRRIKKFLGLSNGSIVECYAAFDDENNTVEILRPNPNAKEVYKTMPIEKEIEYRRNHWYL